MAKSFKNFSEVGTYARKDILEEYAKISKEERPWFLGQRGLLITRTYEARYQESDKMFYIDNLTNPFDGDVFHAKIYASTELPLVDNEKYHVKIHAELPTNEEPTSLNVFRCEVLIYAKQKKLITPKRNDSLPVQTAAEHEKERQQQIERRNKELTQRKEQEQIEAEKRREQKRKEAEKRREQEEREAAEREADAKLAREKEREWLQMRLEERKKLVNDWAMPLTEEQIQSGDNLKYSKEKDCYYTFEYISQKYISPNPVDMHYSSIIRDYKNKRNDAIELFTSKLKDTIEQIIVSNNLIGKHIGLVAIPSSESDKVTAIEKSISKIVASESKYATLYDLGEALYRHRTIQSAHFAQGYYSRPTIEEHMDSIGCQIAVNPFTTEDLYYIVLDDIITTGNTMDACCQIIDRRLGKHKDIYRLVIAKTKKMT